MNQKFTSRNRSSLCALNRHLRQDGSAYLIALLALLVLTMLGMSLTFVTQTEMLVGATEKASQRAFYSAESGIAIAMARILVSHDKRSVSVLLDDAPDEPGFYGVDVKSRLEIAPVYPVFAPPCNYCQINNEGEYKTNSYYKVNHAITVRAHLVAGATQALEKSLATKVITSMVDLQPWNDLLPPQESTDRVYTEN